MAVRLCRGVARRRQRREVHEGCAPKKFSARAFTQRIVAHEWERRRKAYGTRDEIAQR
jgi:hypothetical protein